MTSSSPLSSILAAMDVPSSPITPPRPSNTLGKHPRTDDTELDDEDNLPINPMPSTSSSSTVTVNKNTLAVTKRYGVKKKLRSDQQTELDVFVADNAVVREAKLFANLLAITNRLDRIVNTAPPYTVSSDLEKNIQNYASAVLISSKLATYKGEVPKQHVLAILKKFRFDMPPNIEQNPADWAKVISCVQDGLTQRRGAFKKLIRGSLCIEKNKQFVRLPDKECTNIFSLTARFVEGTKSKVTVPLCSRVALLRKAYIANGGPKYWDGVDALLAGIRTAAGDNAEKLAKGFKHILKEDREKYGKSAEYTIAENATDDFQQEVDDILESRATDAAVIAAAESAEGEHERAVGSEGEAT